MLEHINVSTHDHEQISKENWKDAPGITERAKQGTNSMLAERDYEIKCRYPYKVGVFHGIHIWWCETHHQPLFMCDRARFAAKARSVAEAVLVSDKTDSYEYGGDQDARNRKGEKPPSGTRWLTPRELARDFIAYLKS